MSPNDANSVDPDQTAPLGAVWSGSALFAQAYLRIITVQDIGERKVQNFCLIFDKT